MMDYRRLALSSREPDASALIRASGAVTRKYG
jgi:hypothetical protein